MDKIKSLIIKHIGSEGKMIGGSKGRYCFNHPKNIKTFNGNIFVDKKKYWWGDLDISVSYKELIELSKKVKGKISILSEEDGKEEKKAHFKDPVAVFKDGKMISPKQSEIEFIKDLPYWKPDEDEEDNSWEESKLKITDVYNKDEYEAIPIPFKKFKGTKSKYSKNWNLIKEGKAPFEQLQDFLIKVFGKQKARHIYKNGCTSYSVQKLFEELTEIWMRDKQGIDDEYRIQKDLAWISWTLPPIFYEGTPPWSDTEHIYLKLLDKDGKPLEIEPLPDDEEDE